MKKKERKKKIQEEKRRRKNVIRNPRKTERTQADNEQQGGKGDRTGREPTDDKEADPPGADEERVGGNDAFRPVRRLDPNPVDGEKQETA
jgi:hypothetical protein